MEMQEKKLKRFNVYRIIAKILFIITVIGGSFALLGSIAAEGLLIAKGSEVIGEIQRFITSMGYDYILPLDRIPHMLVISMIISLLLSMALTAYVFREISKLFAHIVETKTPFQTMTTKRIKSMGIAMFVYAGIQAVLSAFMSYGASGIFANEGFFTDHITIKWSIIGFGILLLALAEIFDYGCGLQQDSTSIV